MSVYTLIQFSELEQKLRNYPIGNLITFSGIQAGITNTIYQLETDKNRYILTIFEELTATELPFYLQLMLHFAEKGMPVPMPIATSTQEYILYFSGKPAIITSFLPGHEIKTAQNAHCHALGKLLGEFHLQGLSFPILQKNQRDETWHQNTIERVLNAIPPEDAALLKHEWNFLKGCNFAALPQGIIHADIFRDNVLWEHEQVTGLIDFYYACYDILLLDLAVVYNDWCTDTDGKIDITRGNTLLSAYQSVRPFTENEKKLWPAMLRKAALRFWLSRLNDKYFPPEGELVQTKDPDYFKRIIQNYC